VVTQPEALRLAHTLEATDQMHSNADLTSVEVANELRRLHEVNQELLAALKALHDEDMAYITANRFDEAANNPGLVQARAAIAKATGENK
jgi:hypothetical protein